MFAMEMWHLECNFRAKNVSTDFAFLDGGIRFGQRSELHASNKASYTPNECNYNMI